MQQLDLGKEGKNGNCRENVWIKIKIALKIDETNPSKNVPSDTNDK